MRNRWIFAVSFLLFTLMMSGFLFPETQRAHVKQTLSDTPQKSFLKVDELTNWPDWFFPAENWGKPQFSIPARGYGAKIQWPEARAEMINQRWVHESLYTYQLTYPQGFKLQGAFLWVYDENQYVIEASWELNAGMNPIRRVIAALLISDLQKQLEQACQQLAK